MATVSDDAACDVCGKPRWTAPDHECKQCEEHCKLNDYRRREAGEQLGAPDELGAPSVDDLAGIDPWYTGDQSTDEYLRSVRGGESTGGAEHDHTLQRWTCGCDPMLEGLKLAAEQSGNIEIRTLPTR